MERVSALNIDVLTGAINPMPQVVDEGDSKLHVIFGEASHFNDVKTRELQRPVFEMMDYVTIMVPGDQTSIVHRPVRESDKRRFPRQWAAYSEGKSQTSGTPLSDWNKITRAQADELSYGFRINTVEQLASISDANVQKFMGLAQLRDMAKAWLEQQAGEEPLNRIQAEAQARQEENAALKNQLLMLQEQMAEMQKLLAKKGKKGREEVEDIETV